jgi:hypothetical protein
MAEPQNVDRGEQRFNAAFYKASHNSYDRDESLASQIDDYNVWQLELDIYDYEGDLKVNHNCDAGSLDAASSLSFLLNKMVAESATYYRRFTVIYLDMKGNGLDGCLVNWGENINERLKSIFIESLGGDHIYPSTEFINIDKSFWPSWQNLVRRGYYWCIVVDWHGERPDNAINDPLFFEATSSNPPDADNDPENMLLICVDGGCDSYPTSDDPKLKNDRLLYRIYPGAGCALDCQQQNGNYWQNGVNRQYNLVASNCVNWDHTFQPPMHSPAPLFVNAAAAVNCPMDYNSCEWGTRGFPFHNLAAAIYRASPMVTVFIEAGDYVTRTSGVEFRIHQPVIFKPINGTVRIH